MISFILGIILVVAAVVVFFTARHYRKKDRRALAAQAEQTTDRYSRTTYSGEHEDTAAYLTIGGFVCLALGVIFTIAPCVQIVEANSVGIPVEVGSIKAPVNSGFHVMVPWADVHTFSTRLQELSMLSAIDEGDKAKDDSVEVRGSDGYKMNVDITVRYFIEGSEASTLFKLVGSEDGVKQRLVRPDVRNRTRVAFADFTSEEGYTSKRDAIAANLIEDLTPRLAAYGLKLESVSIRNVSPDPVLAKAISDRAAAREQALQAEIDQKKQTTEAETRRLVAKTDAEAKVIAATAEAQSNEIITKSITPDLLTLKQIEALRDANTVYIAPGTSIIVGQQTPK